MYHHQRRQHTTAPTVNETKPTVYFVPANLNRSGRIMVRKTKLLTNHRRRQHEQQKKSSLPDRKSQSKLDTKALCPCGRSFSYLAGYRYHLRWECGKNLSCAACPKTFTDKSNLNKHLRLCPFLKSSMTEIS